MSGSLPSKRPFLVSLVALFPFGLAVWYLGTVLWSGLMAGVELLREAGAAGLPPEIGIEAVTNLAVGLTVAVLGFSTARALRRGAGWSRLAVPFLALFAFPAGSPYDVIAAGLGSALLFGLPGPRRFFGKGVREEKATPG